MCLCDQNWGKEVKNVRKKIHFVKKKKILFC